MVGLAMRAVIFDSPHSVLGRADRRVRVSERFVAVPAFNLIPPGGPIDLHSTAAMRADRRCIGAWLVVQLYELLTIRAHNNVLRVSRGFSEQVAWEEVI